MTERIPRAAILKELARIDATLFSLGLDLEDDLTEEDIAAGAEPLSAEHIQAELSKVRSTILKIALGHIPINGIPKLVRV
jgi:hypothetical protein